MKGEALLDVAKSTGIQLFHSFRSTYDQDGLFDRLTNDQLPPNKVIINLVELSIEDINQAQYLPLRLEG